jgi:hypothetical protein
MNESMLSPESGDQGHSAEDVQLDALFRAYNLACEPGEVSPNFMPELWQKIEGVQSAAFSFRRIAKAFVTVAAGLTLVLAGFEALPYRQVSPVFSATYIEALADHTDIDASDLARPDLSDFAEEI